MSAGQLPRVVVVDDHPVFRRGLTGMLRASGYDVAGEATTGLEAVQVMGELAGAGLAPDVVLMDLAMPHGDGFDATARIAAEHPSVAVVVISLFADEASVRRALGLGAAGYVGKHAEPEQILAALEAARGGALWIGGGVARPGFGGAGAPGDGGGGLAPTRTGLPGGLTPREADVAELLGRGLPNPAIASLLHLSSKTVANYVSSVVLKLGAADRAEAARVVRTHRDGPPPEAR